MIPTRLALVFLIAFAQGSHAASPRLVEATLTLPYETVLPGVPFDMTVTLKNVSSSPVSVGTIARLMVTMPDGANISRDLWMTLLEPRPAPSAPAWVELAAGESRQFYVDWHRYSQNFSHDPDFSGPGVYGLALQLTSNGHPDNYVGEVVTNTARLVRFVPPGEDEALWKRMMVATDARWADDSLYNSNKGLEFLHEILQIHPGSAYYPYAIILERHVRPLRPATKADIAKALEAAERFRSSPAHSHLLLHAGNVADTIAVYAWHDRDYKTFFEYAALADQYYGDAAKATKIPGVRESAGSAQRSVRTEVENQRQRDAGTYSQRKQ